MFAFHFLLNREWKKNLCWRKLEHVRNVQSQFFVITHQCDSRYFFLLHFRLPLCWSLWVAWLCLLDVYIRFSSSLHVFVVLGSRFQTVPVISDVLLRKLNIITFPLRFALSPSLSLYLSRLSSTLLLILCAVLATKPVIQLQFKTGKSLSGGKTCVASLGNI